MLNINLLIMMIKWWLYKSNRLRLKSSLFKLLLLLFLEEGFESTKVDILIKWVISAG